MADPQRKSEDKGNFCLKSRDHPSTVGTYQLVIKDAQGTFAMCSNLYYNTCVRMTATDDDRVSRSVRVSNNQRVVARGSSQQSTGSS